MLVRDNVSEPIQEPVAVTVNPVQEPVTVQAVAAQEPVQEPTVQTPVAVKATPAKSILTPPPTVEARSLTKRPRIRFVNYLEEDDRPSRRSRRLPKSHPYKYSQDEEDYLCLTDFALY